MDYKAGMFVYALAFLLGIVFVQQLATLPGASLQFLLLSLILLYVVVYSVVYVQVRHDIRRYITSIMTVIILINIGIIYSSFYAKQQLSFRLNDDLVGQNIVINGVVSSIPVADDKVQRFEFNVQSHRTLSTSDDQPSVNFPKKIRLSWYYGQAINAGEQWQLEVRLKPPHGFMNPGGFDYEAWLFQQGVHATGYVRKSSFNKLKQQSETTINSIRQSISRQIDAIHAEQDAVSPEGGEIRTSSLLKALAVGDKSAITNQQWRVLANTGTSHLMAISGLHIGLASLFAYVLIRRMLPVAVMKRVPAQHVALTGGMVAALCYALIAGLSVPTQRAIIMLSVLSVMMLVRRNHRPVDALGFALVVVLLLDPLAVLSAGFWFSFSAVAVIFISLSSNSLAVEQGTDAVKSSFMKTVLLVLKRWVRLQLLISLFLLPLSLFMFQQVSLISPLVNLMLIPYVSFLVVPLVLLAIIFSFFLPYVSQVLFMMAGSLLDFVWPVLSYVSALPYSLWVRGDVDVHQLLAATVMMLLLYFSSQLSAFYFRRINQPVNKYACWSLRLAVCLIFIPVLMPAKEVIKPAEYKLTVLDVGQGSAAVIRTQNHVMVFDAGAKFSDRLNAGSGVVLPYLRSQGLYSLDRLVISHGDADHIGGAQAILDAHPEALVLGQDIDNLQVKNKQLCISGTSWRWDGVDFSFLSPASGERPLTKSTRRNDHSCVLQVASTSGSVLFTGDIEKKSEQRLLDEYGEQLDSDILIVPHHGSDTSSSLPFINVVNPVLSVISVGYMNRYRLPSSKVMQRYDSAGRGYVRTDKTGALTVKLTADAGSGIEKYREKAGKYWHHTSD